MRLENALPVQSRGSTWSVVGAATILLGMAVAPSAARAAAPQLLFGNPVSYDVAVTPHSLAVADLNGDGRPDIATVSGSLTVLFGSDSGQFGGRVDYKLPSWGYHVDAGDLDGDGDIDLVVTTGSSVLVFLNSGNGVFGTPTPCLAGSGSSVLADLNGDHVLDLAVASDSLYVLLGRGDGTFQHPVAYPAGNVPIDLAAGDLDGDGRTDLIDVNSLGIVAPSAIGERTMTDNSTVSVFLNGGQGTFGSRVGYAPSLFAVAVAVGDFTGDGIPDLVETDSYQECACGKVYVLPGNGDGTFGAAIDGNIYASYPTHVAVADLNADGKLDLAIGENGSYLPYDYVIIALGNGDGTFAFHEESHVGLGSLSVALSDVNGDGKLDLITVNAYSNTVSVAFGSVGSVGVTPPGDGLALEGARPDPAISGLTVAFSLPDAAPATLSVYSVSGRRVLSRQLEGLGPGRHVLDLDQEAPLASGVYLLRLTHGNRSFVRRAVVLR